MGLFKMPKNKTKYKDNKANARYQTYMTILLTQDKTKLKQDVAGGFKRKF